jgi:hypothetical protein
MPQIDLDDMLEDHVEDHPVRTLLYVYQPPTPENSSVEAETSD